MFLFTTFTVFLTVEFEKNPSSICICLCHHADLVHTIVSLLLIAKSGTTASRNLHHM